MVLPCSHCNSEFCEEMEDGEFEGIPMEIPMGIEMQGNPIGDLLTNLMGQMARMPDNIPENGADIGITIIEDGGDSRARRFRRRQQQRARDEAVDNGDDQGDIRNFMAQQVMNQLAELLFQRAPGGRPPPNFGDYAVGQGGLDEIITR